MKELDMRESKETSQQRLGQQIVDAVEASQKYVIQPYPDKLILTLAQYNILSGRNPATPFERDNEFFHTDYNSMEIEVEGYEYKRPTLPTMEDIINEAR